MAKKSGQPGDDVSTAPESGTERDDTTGSADDPRRGARDASGAPPAADDPSSAPEER